MYYNNIFMKIFNVKKTPQTEESYENFSQNKSHNQQVNRVIYHNNSNKDSTHTKHTYTPNDIPYSAGYNICHYNTYNPINNPINNTNNFVNNIHINGINVENYDND
jgi:hypothetical protein